MDTKDTIMTLESLSEEERMNIFGKDRYELLKRLKVKLLLINTHRSLDLAHSIYYKTTTPRRKADFYPEGISAEFDRLIESITSYIQGWSGGVSTRSRNIYDSLLDVASLVEYEKCAQKYFSKRNLASVETELDILRGALVKCSDLAGRDPNASRLLRIMTLSLIDRLIDAYRTFRYKERMKSHAENSRLDLIGDIDTFLLDTLYLKVMEDSKIVNSVMENKYPVHLVTSRIFGAPIEYSKMTHLGKDYTAKDHQKFLVNSAIEILEELQVNRSDMRALYPSGLALPIGLEAGRQAKNILQEKCESSAPVDIAVSLLLTPNLSPVVKIKYVFSLIEELDRLKQSNQ